MGQLNRNLPRLLPPVLGLCLACSGVPSPADLPVDPTPPGRSRILFIAFDAIPYDTVARLTDPEHEADPIFTGLRGPSPLISTFPSTTTVAFTGLFEPLGIDRPPGYEARFYDWERNRVRGGGPRSYSQIPFSWREWFDWKTEGAVRKAVGLGRPVTFGRFEVKKAVAAFLESDREVFFAYIGATDGVSHLRGPDALENVLRELDAALKELRHAYPRHQFHTVLFSDHGISPGKRLKNVLRPVRRAMRQAGFRVGKRLKTGKDVIFVPFGLVSSFVVHTNPGREAEASQVLARVPGVDFCVHELEDGWQVQAAEGRAQIKRRQRGSRLEFSYRPTSADPLGYAPILRSLRRNGGPRAVEGWFTDETWLEATRKALHPDALYRISRAFDLVENSASAICTTGREYMFGALAAELASHLSVSFLKWTHGAMEREATFGFIMSDHPAWDPSPAQRFDRALRPFAPLVAEKLRDREKIAVTHFE